MSVTFFIFTIIAGLLFIRSYHKLLVVYRKKKNPDFPLLPSESMSYFSEDPIKFLKELPIMPFLRWKIVFETHRDLELSKATNNARKTFAIFVLVIIINFIIQILYLF